MNGRLVLTLLLVVALLTPAGCGLGGENGGSAGDRATGGTLVFALASDPVALDGALVSDVESLHVVRQVFETLVSLEPGTTELAPGLAESWEISSDGLDYVFHLREGVSFHDGEALDAQAVCFNFERWHSFAGSLRAAAEAWRVGFGQAQEGSLFESCEAPDERTVVLGLTRPSPAVLAALALPGFSIASPKALEEFRADEGTLGEDGSFQPTGSFGTDHPIGTGPFRFESWTPDDRLVLVRNDGYWGQPAKLESLVFRPIPDSGERLQALQSGEIHGYDLVEPRDLATIESDDGLQVLDRPAFSVGYVGINQAIPPLDKLEVRQAIAHGLNRRAVVDSFYAGRGEPATQFMPPGLAGYADDVTEYEYDPARSKQLLRDAGLTLPVEIELWYPSDVSRPYMPDPRRNAEAFAASLEKSGFKVKPKAVPWSPDYLDNVDGGDAQLYLLGWTGSFGDPDDFVGTFFQTAQPAWGFENAEIFAILDRAEAETDLDARTQLYEVANRLIMDFLPGVPYVHTSPALAFSADVQGYAPSPVSRESFASVTIGL